MLKHRYFNNVFGNNKLSYNCGGFALNECSWITPWVSDDYDDYDDLIYDDNNNIFNLNYTYENGYTNSYRKHLIYTLSKHLSYDQITNIILENDADYLIKTYSYLQRCELENTNACDKIIAYRIFYKLDENNMVIDYDFHFKVRIDGCWYEKLGGNVIQYANLDDWDYSELCYNSATIYFKDSRY